MFKVLITLCKNKLLFSLCSMKHFKIFNAISESDFPRDSVNVLYKGRQDWIINTCSLNIFEEQGAVFKVSYKSLNCFLQYRYKKNA